MKTTPENVKRTDSVWMRQAVRRFAVLAFLAITPFWEQPAKGAIATFNDEASFLSGGIQGDYFHPVFVDDFELVDPSYGPGGSGNWQFQIAAASGAVTAPVNDLGNGGIGVGPLNILEGFTITFSGSLPTAVGGNFFWVDAEAPDTLMTGTVKVTANLSGGGSTTIDVSSTAPSTFGFGGFASDSAGFTSLTISFDSSPGNAFSTVGNFYVGVAAVPEPGTWMAGGFLALVVAGRAGWGILRRRFIRA